MRRKLFRALALAAAAVMLFTACSKQSAESSEEGPPSLQFASEGVTALDEATLQAAVDELAELKDPIAIYYNPDAYSKDGINFSCKLGNSTANTGPCYFSLYADAECSDQLALTGAIRPGEAFETIKLDRALEKGAHTVYVAETLVDEDLTTAINQVVFTITFTVA